MNPLDPASFTHKSIDLPSGHTYHYIDQSPEATKANGKAVLCMHGFPDLWFGYRYQIPALVNAGYRCIVPSQLGYHESSKPEDVKEYAVKRCANDNAELLRMLGIKRAAVIGHDWGGWLAYRFAEYHPSMVEKLAVICTPYVPPSKPGQPFMPLEEMVKKVPNFNYQLFFTSPQAIELFNEQPLLVCGRLSAQARAATAEDNKKNPTLTKEKSAWASEKGNMEAKMRHMLASGKLQAPPDGYDPELSYYYNVGKKNSYKYPLNWYKTREINHIDEITNLSGGFPSNIPVLFVACGIDAALPPHMSAKMGDQIKLLDQRLVASADHWILQDPLHRDDLNKTLVDWFKAE